MYVNQLISDAYARSGSVAFCTASAIAAAAVTTAVSAVATATRSRHILDGRGNGKQSCEKSKHASFSFRWFIVGWRGINDHSSSSEELEQCSATVETATDTAVTAVAAAATTSAADITSTVVSAAANKSPNIECPSLRIKNVYV